MSLTPSSGAKLRRYTELEYILIGDLRDLLEEPLEDENIGWLLTVLDALLDTLPVEFELKEEGGYLEEVLEEFPNWPVHVSNLRNNHEHLCGSLQELRDRIATQTPYGAVPTHAFIILGDPQGPADNRF